MKLAAEGIPVASFSSLTSCQELRASRKLMKPGRPLSTVTGRSLPSFMKMLAGFWLGLQPYFSSNLFMSVLSPFQSPRFLLKSLTSPSTQVYRETLLSLFSAAQTSSGEGMVISMGSPEKEGRGEPSPS